MKMESKHEPKMNLTVNYQPAPTVESQTVDGAFLVEDKVVPNGLNGIAKCHVAVFRQRRIRKNKYLAIAAVFFIVVLLLIAGLIAGMYHPGFDTVSSLIPDHEQPPPSRLMEPECGTRPGFSRQKRVIHGLSSELGQWPWQASIEFQGTYLCGAVVVAPQWVFTAAHCVTGYVKGYIIRPEDLTVVAGSLFREKRADHEGQNRTVLSKHVHPLYSQEYEIFNYDIAMLKLSEPLDINNDVRTICLDLPSTLDLSPGQKCYVAGWGSTTPREVFDHSLDLIYAEVPLISREDCLAYAWSRAPIQQRQVTPQKICAGYWDLKQPGISAPCKGDSGSPLVCEDPTTRAWYLVGLVSAGVKCGDISYFTNVSAMESFYKLMYNESALPPAEFNCNDGNATILRENVCDGNPNCADMSDETECECTDLQFRCDNNMCLLYTKRCNGKDDCGDGSDEINCSYFNCSNGQQVSVDAPCDGEDDCLDRSDERNEICEYNPATHFQCEEGRRIPRTWVCDGWKDCNKSEDEIGCNCTDDQFFCDKGCIHDYFVCDNFIDCEDRRDEQNCSCSEDQFYCQPAGLCWEYSMKEYCDNYEPYKNASDIFIDFCWSEMIAETCTTIYNSVPLNDTVDGYSSNGG